MFFYIDFYCAGFDRNFYWSQISLANVVKEKKSNVQHAVLCYYFSDGIIGPMNQLT